MKIVSFNVNSVRQRQHQLEAVVEGLAPDIIGLQETKVTDEDFPILDMTSLGYHATFIGQKTHYGVAILSKKMPEFVQKGFPEDDAESQKRFIHIAVRLDNGGLLHILNGYFPQGEANSHPTKYPAKRKFYEDLQHYIETTFTPTDNVAVIGDLNIAATDHDIGIGADNAKRWLKTGKCSFLPEEREWFARLMDWGFTDTYRAANPEANDEFSWFDYRSKGFEREPRRGLRIDYVLASKPLADNVVATGIDYATRAMPKPSDHCPVWTEFKI